MQYEAALQRYCPWGKVPHWFFVGRGRSLDETSALTIEVFVSRRGTAGPRRSGFRLLGTESFPWCSQSTHQPSGGSPVRVLSIAIGLALLSSSASAGAQTDQTTGQSIHDSTARTPPEDRGQLQPQGWTGPTDTKSGGAPAESPQGQSPPGMQAAPEGSGKTVVEPDK
jgi:hypothetical protein